MFSLTSYPKVTAITVINNPKKNSNFLRPYLSRKRNVNVSNTVIITPIYKGIVLADKRKIAIAVPITSCLQFIKNYIYYELLNKNLLLTYLTQ